ncbi:MAG: zinc ribbon domain-containing protein [Promethearchaeota archaeon]
MKELVIKQQIYLKIPEDLGKISEYHSKIEKLSFHHCTNCQILLTASDWNELRYIELIGCKYVQFSVDFSQASKLEQIFFSNVEYVDIDNFHGNFPMLMRWMMVDSKYIKFKGTFAGANNLELLEFNNTTHSELFHGEVVLDNLIAIRFLNGCHFFTINFQKLNAKKLRQLWFRDSNYLNIMSLGSTAPKLQSFRFDNCAFPKLNVDFSQLNQASTSIETAQIENYIEKLSNILPFPFRNARKRSKRKKNRRKSSHIIPNTQLPPDIQLIKETPTVSEALSSARTFLDETGSEINENEIPFDKSDLEIFPREIFQGDSTDTPKFCPECGAKNSIQAQFCNNCGNQFPF